MARNYMLDFMQGYQFGDNINRQDRAEVRQDEATRRSNELQDRQIAKYDKDLGEQEAQKGLNAARYEVATTGDISPETLAKLSPEFQKNYAASSPEVKQELAAKVQNPQRISEELDLWNGISTALDQGKLPDGEMTKRYLNSAGKEELARRGGDDGLERSVFGVIPSPDGSGLMFDLKVTGKDGKSYNAPATEKGLAAGNGDDVVATFPVQKVIKWGGDKAALNKMLEAELIRAGDTTIMAAYQKRQEAAAKRVADREDKSWEYANDPSKQPKPVAIGPRGLYDPKSGKTITGGGGAGGVGGGKGKWIQDENGEWQFLSTDQTATGKGKQHVKQNEDGTTTIYDEGSGKMRTVYTPEAAMQRAQAMAQAEADAVGSQWTSLQPSAEKTNARAKEIYAELMGNAVGAPADGKPEAPKFSPGQKLTQAGKSFVVDANGIPQEQGSNPQEKQPRKGKEPADDQAHMTQEQKDAASLARGRGLGPLPVPNKALAGLSANNERVLRDAAETKEKVRAGLSKREKTAEETELARLAGIAATLKAKKARGALSTGKDQEDYQKALDLGLITAPIQR